MLSAMSRKLASQSLTSVLRRSYHHEITVVGPPRTRISLAEKAAHGFVLFCAISFPPMYISSNVVNYKTRAE